jgi:hypothetical protein
MPGTKMKMAKRRTNKARRTKGEKKLDRDVLLKFKLLLSS